MTTVESIVKHCIIGHDLCSTAQGGVLQLAWPTFGY